MQAPARKGDVMPPSLRVHRGVGAGRWSDHAGGLARAGDFAC